MLDFSLTEDQLAIRAAVERICAPFDDDYWLQQGPRRRLPARLPRGARRRRLARHRDAHRSRRRGPGHHRGGDPDADGDGDGRRHRGRLVRAHEHLRPASGRGVRHAGAAAALAAAADRGRAQGVLRRDRARRRPQHAEAQDDGGARRRPLRRARPEDLDLHRAGGAQDPAARAHHAHRRGEDAPRRLEPLLHRPRPHQGRRARDREDGPQGGRLQRALHRRPAHPGRGPHRRRGQGLRLHPARPESRADPARRRSHRPRSRGAAPRGRVREGARGVRSPDRQEPGHPASAGRALDGTRSGQPA